MQEQESKTEQAREQKREREQEQEVEQAREQKREREQEIETEQAQEKMQEKAQEKTQEGRPVYEERLEKQLEFIRVIDQEKSIFRQTYLADGSRKENDAEHAWHLAIMAFLLAEHANEPVDVLKVMKMVLIHDLVEIYAGDTYAYDAEGAKTQHDREMAAADRLFVLLPGDQAEELRDIWEEFERRDTPEARFAKTLDNFQPLLLNDASDGRSWKEHGVYARQVYARNQVTPEGSERIWAYQKDLIEKNIEKGYLQK